MHPKRTSYRQIAIEAGVSFKTLYRVLNHEPNVTDSTREKVLRAMKRHGCIDARLPDGCSVVIYVDANDYMLTYARILAKRLRDFPVKVRLFQASTTKISFLRMVEKASRLVYFEFMPEDLLDACRDVNPTLKVICINGYQADINIGCDYFQQGRIAAEYLHHRGFRSLGIIHGNYMKEDPCYHGLHERAMGCRHDWMFEYGHDEPDHIFDIESYLAEKRPLPSVFFAVNTYLSNQFIRRAAEHHLKFLEDYYIFTAGRPEDSLRDCPDLDCVYHEMKDLLDIAITFLFNPNLSNIHSQIVINVKSNLQIIHKV